MMQTASISQVLAPRLRLRFQKTDTNLASHIKACGCRIAVRGCISQSPPRLEVTVEYWDCGSITRSNGSATASRAEGTQPC